MKTDRKTSNKLTASESSRLPKAKMAKQKGAVEKMATRRKDDVVAAIGAARKVSKKKAPAAKATKVATKKPVRDDFKMPAHDYALIQTLKQRALEFNQPTKKNELLRAGLQALGALDNTQFQQCLLALSPIVMKRPIAKPAKNSKAKA